MPVNLHLKTPNQWSGNFPPHFSAPPRSQSVSRQNGRGETNDFLMVKWVNQHQTNGRPSGQILATFIFSTDGLEKTVISSLKRYQRKGKDCSKSNLSITPRFKARVNGTSAAVKKSYQFPKYFFTTADAPLTV